MKRTGLFLTALLVCGVVYAAQDTTITVREVRNPNDLQTFLEANATDAESRLTSGSTTASDLTLVNQNDAGTSGVSMQADKADDAGDMYGVTATDGAGLAIQSDITSKGTLATKITLSNVGGIAAADAITLTDADGGAAISSIGFEANDATVVLDADQGDDNADTWIIESEAADNDLSIVNHATERLNITAAGLVTVPGTFTSTGAATASSTLAVVGVATFTAESVHNAGIDADGITVDASDGIDTKAAGTLLVGDATATKVEVADTSVETEIQGTLDVLGDSDFNEQITIDLDAADEEIDIDQTAVAGTADVPLISINDDRTGATANTAGEATMVFDSEGTHAIAVLDGIVAVESIVDTYAAGSLLLGSATATRVELGDTAIVIDAEGPLHATEFVLSDEVDSLTATALLIGKATATSVEIADAAVTTDIQGPVTILGTTGAGLDTAGATAMFIAEATATSLSLGASDINTISLGPVTILAGIDTTGASAMTVGAATATSLAIGAADITTTSPGILLAPVYRTSVTNALVTDTLVVTDGSVITVDSTAGAVALTLPDANTVLGATYKILFVTDGGDLTIVRAGADTFNSAGNTLLTGADAEDFVVLVAVSANRWLIQSNTGFAASTP